MSDAGSEQPPTVQPTRRVYRERQHSGPATDAQDQLVSIASVVMGFALGGLFGVRFEVGFLTGGLAGIIISYVSAKLFLAVAVKTISASLNPSGASTPYKSEYSQVQSLMVRGKYGEAAEAWEIAALESDGDPEPYLQLARLYRDKLHQYDDALAWFRRARTDARLSGGQELLAIQEIIELYTNKLGTPRKALPELITLCERFPKTPAADGAEREIAEMREMMARELDGVAPVTAQYLESRRRRSRDAP